jgi:hypothetical protein
MKKNILVAVLLVGIVVLGYVSWRMNHKVAPPGAGTQVPLPTTSNVNDLKVVWETPKKIATLPGLVMEPLPEFLPATDISFKEVGTISGGKYDQGKLLTITMPNDGIGGAVPFRIVAKDGKYHILGIFTSAPTETAKYLGSFGFNTANVDVDTESTISALIAPETLADTAHGVHFKKVQDAVEMQGFSFTKPLNPADLKKVFTDQKAGDVYTEPLQNGFYTINPDGTHAVYAYQIPFVSEGKPAAVVWNNGTLNTTEYGYTDSTGCGSRSYYSVAPDGKLSMNDLAKTGVTNTGEPIYAFKDYSNPYYLDLTQGIYVPGQADSANSNAGSYFADKKPFFFWKNPYGQLVKFTNSALQPAAECGKPVIYLYPTTEQKVSVKLAPVGGFSVTEPAYNSGWDVIAKPTGELLNLADKKIYPYLFWEGRGGIYQTPDKGWVIAQKDVHSFLVEKLKALGLNTKESADFMEFWEPKMQGSPYYFVTFMGNNAMNQIAPLNVTPAPDTVIRILMDFQPLNKKISVQGFDIRTPERKGFTVVEWGGVLRK